MTIRNVRALEDHFLLVCDSSRGASTILHVLLEPRTSRHLSRYPTALLSFSNLYNGKLKILDLHAILRICKRFVSIYIYLILVLLHGVKINFSTIIAKRKPKQRTSFCDKLAEYHLINNDKRL